MESFGALLVMALILSFPFGFIYFVLKLLEWNDSKNLFADSWIVYITWLASSFFSYIVGLLLIEPIFFHYQNRFIFSAGIIFFTVLINVCAIAGVLYLRSREKKMFDMASYLNEKVQTPDIRKIWRTSVIVSISTLVFIISLVMAAADISEKWERRKTPNKLSFGVYDI